MKVLRLLIFDRYERLLRCIERSRVEPCLNIFQTPDFELFWVSVNDFSSKCMDKRVWVEEHWTIRKPDLALLDRLEILLGDAGLANSSGTEVDDLVAVLVYLGVQVSHPRVGPVLACKHKLILILTKRSDKLLPIAGRMWPRTSDLVIVPSMSEMTSLSVFLHRKM